VTTQSFDLVLIGRGESVSVTGGQIAHHHDVRPGRRVGRSQAIAHLTGLVDDDVTGFLAGCVKPGTLPLGPGRTGRTFRCPGLQVRASELTVTMTLSDGSSIADQVRWLILPNPEP
jgi:hypothetical protein